MKRFMIICSVCVALYGEGDHKTLSPAQQALRKGQHPHTTNYTISEVLGGGSEIVLNDGSHWEIAPSGRNLVGGWLGPAEVKVSYIGGKRYPYKMTNKWTQSSVMCRKMVPQNEQQ